MTTPRPDDYLALIERERIARPAEAALLDYIVALESRVEQYQERRHATVYERAAWRHDIGKHAGSDHPYAFCPRCEVEHSEGRLAVAERELDATEARLSQAATILREQEAWALECWQAAADGSLACDMWAARLSEARQTILNFTAAGLLPTPQPAEGERDG